jgi:hypothetical protein
MNIVAAYGSPIDGYEKEPNRDVVQIFLEDGRCYKVTGLEIHRGRIDQDWWNEIGESRYGTWHDDEGHRVVDWTGWPLRRRFRR